MLLYLIGCLTETDRSLPDTDDTKVRQRGCKNPWKCCCIKENSSKSNNEYDKKVKVKYGRKGYDT